SAMFHRKAISGLRARWKFRIRAVLFLPFSRSPSVPSSRQQGFEMLFNEVYAQVYDRVLREKQREPEA
ncbi:hypothetical protein, partial [Escherichia coli]|uniref:hypothetical protein n=1 Tax=Escherichia coli TaxID=562 RepID=UPI0032C234B6